MKNEKKLVFRNVEFEIIPDKAESRVKQSVNAYDITTMKYAPTPPNYKKHSKGLWVNMDTGEAITPKKKDYKSRESLSKTFKRIRDIIVHNYVTGESELFITLTFSRFVTDTNELNDEFKKFWKKLNSRKSEDYSPPYRCLAVIELQQNGNYHFHCLLKRLDGKKLTISQNELKELWVNGSATATNIYDAEALSRYLNTFYVRKKQWSIDFYPADLRIYRCRGDFEPVREFKSEHGESVKEAERQGYVLNHTSTTAISLVEADMSEILVNTIQKESYIKKQR